MFPPDFLKVYNIHIGQLTVKRENYIIQLSEFVPKKEEK